MVADEIRDLRPDDRSPSDRMDRGQIILIGAVALAFIILGVVVVFNGVLYTETLSSADTGQSASSAETTELEVRQGLACLMYHTGSETINDDLKDFNDSYRQSIANSKPALIDIEPAGSAFVVTYESEDLSYTRTFEGIEPEHCPESNAGVTGGGSSGGGSSGSSSDEGDSEKPSIDHFVVNPNDATSEEYTVDWIVSGDDLSSVTIELTDGHKGDDASHTVSGDQATDTSELESHHNFETDSIEIHVEDSAGRTVTDSWEPN